MRFFTLIETTVGVLEVETKTIPWIWTLLTLGLFRKAECRISGSALKRHCQVQMESAKRFGSSPLSTSSEWASEVKILRTIYCRVAFWHSFTVEYVQAQGRTISEHHRSIQWQCALDDAVQNGNMDRAQELIRDEEARSKEDLERWRKFKPFS